MNEPEKVIRSGSGALERMRMRLKLVGKFGFWIQLALGVSAALSWLVVAVGQSSYGGLSAGAILAFWATLFTLISLGANLFYTWQYQKLSSQLGSGSSPGAEFIFTFLQKVIYISLVGALLALISLAAQVGDLLGSYFFLRIAVGRFQVLGLLLAVANTNITLAHFLSLTSALWINGILDRSR